MSSSSLSPVIPSPGYVADSAAIWVGTKIILLIITVNSRRIWRAARLTKHMKKVPGPDLQEWLVGHRQSVNQLVDDLLKLLSYIEFLAISIILNNSVVMIIKQEFKGHLLSMGRASTRL
jgi:hypothetical protein